MAPVTFVYFCYGWTLWTFLSWVPQFMLHAYKLNLKNSALFSSLVFFGGVLGDALGGWLSDRILRRTGSLDAGAAGPGGGGDAGFVPVFGAGAVRDGPDFGGAVAWAARSSLRS